jgi:hypothetical protein
MMYDEVNIAKSAYEADRDPDTSIDAQLERLAKGLAELDALADQVCLRFASVCRPASPLVAADTVRAERRGSRVTNAIADRCDHAGRIVATLTDLLQRAETE